MAATNSTAPGMIEDHILYRADEFMKRMGWGRKSFDLARRRGLETHKSGKRIYVLGRKAREYVERDTPAATA